MLKVAGLKRWRRWVWGGVLALSAGVLPSAEAELPSVADWVAREPAAMAKFDRNVDRIARHRWRAEAFQTGSALFDGEWLFGNYLMAGIGSAQAQLRLPPAARDPRVVERIHVCIAQIIDPVCTRFTAAKWGGEPLETLDNDRMHHAAYLGYLNILLGLTRELDPHGPYADLHDRVTAALVRRLRTSPGMVLQTYPGEAYPCDIAASVGSIALYDRVVGPDAEGRRAAVVRDAVAVYRKHFLDPATGLVYQAVSPATRKPTDHPRGSGSALTALFMAYTDDDLSQDILAAIKQHLLVQLGPAAAVREYTTAVPDGPPDIDSGEILPGGLGTSATGFTVGVAAAQGDAELVSALLQTSYIFGGPVIEAGDRFVYRNGYPLSNAIMYAMLTWAPPR